MTMMFVTIKFRYKNGVRGTFTVTAFTNNQFREISLFGTKGSIYASGLTNEIIIRKHMIDENAETCTYVIKPERIIGGHNGGDIGLMDDFVRLVSGTTKEVRTCVEQSIQSHIMSYACEKSRVEKRRIEIEKFKNELRLKE